jgi:hypothetical protein
MSIEDVNYLKENSIKQTYTFLIDSSGRDRTIFPDPNNYVVEFSTPFRNIIGMEIIDASIPRTMYNVDIENNSIYYYIGTDDNDSLIKDGVTDEIEADAIVTTALIVNNSLNIKDRGYVYIKNIVNLYNIYNSGGIGGAIKGITISLKLTAFSSYKNFIGADNSYTLLDFRYNHLINPKISEDAPIIVKLIRQNSETQTYNLLFRIGNETNEKIINNINLSYLTHIAWTISENNIWQIYLNATTDPSKTHESSIGIKNVFYTDKYIGKRFELDYGDWDTANLYISDFKIYNRVLNQKELYDCNNNVHTNTISNLIIWYKMDVIINGTVENSGNNKTINYQYVFNKLDIMPGDYTLKTFFTNYDELNNFEIGFKEHSDPSELTNLMDIYSRKPFILDMKRSTISENLGFDLHANQNTLGRYIYKDIYRYNNNMIKIFHSVTNDNQVKEFNDGKVDIYKIVSPGIVYFIGNKYIVMKCPEIEAHLYGSLSYSKYTLGLAKFRVDNVGINSERLSITKLPVREFHPIGKLAKMSLRFETNKGTLYDFKGVNHNIVFAIYYYEPIQKKFPEGSLLNPEYKMNYIDYQYNQEEIEGDSDDDEEDFSRDNIMDYKKKEKMYSEEGMQLQQYNKFFVNEEESSSSEED